MGIFSKLQRALDVIGAVSTGFYRAGYWEEKPSQANCNENEHYVYDQNQIVSRIQNKMFGPKLSSAYPIGYHLIKMANGLNSIRICDWGGLTVMITSY